MVFLHHPRRTVCGAGRSFWLWKSTILRLLAGLEEVSAGELLVEQDQRH